MQRILLFSTANGESSVIKKKIEESLDQVIIESCKDEHELMKNIVTKLYRLVVLNIDTYSIEKLQLARDLRTLGNSSPIVILAPSLEKEVIDRVERLFNVVILEKPLRKGDLVGVIQKFLKSDPVSQRFDQRYFTNEKVVFEPFGTAMRVKSTMLNLSKTGAYIECEKNPNVVIGDLVRMSVDLDEINKKHCVHGKVVWIQPKAKKSTTYGAGVHFISDSEIYQHMLNMV